MSDRLLYYSRIPLLTAPQRITEQIPGYNNFLKMANFFTASVGIIDRTGTITVPFKCQITNPIPEFNPNFNMSYKECVMQRMQELDALHQSTGKTFRVLYSGGIDSTGMLAAFIEYYGIDRASQLLEISCSTESIDENPWAWERYIKAGNFKLTTSHNHGNAWDDDKILIMGEINDHLFGGLGAGRWSQYCIEHRTDLYAPLSIELLIRFFLWNNIKQNKANAYYCAIRLKQIADAAPIPINNMHLFQWWYNFVLGWEPCLYRIMNQANYVFPKDTLTTRFHQFFNTPELQQWALNFHYKNPDRFAESEYYKKDCKDMILDILDIPEYAAKNKFGSFPRVHSLRPIGCVIDTDLNKYTDVSDFLKFIEPVNSFVK